MKDFIICILTKLPEILTDTTTITTVNVPECYRIDLTYENGTPIEIQVKILKDFLEKHYIKYNSTEKKDGYGKRHTISFEFSGAVIECNFTVFGYVE